MAAPIPSTAHPRLFAPFPESGEALVRLLDGTTPDWDEVAGGILRDPLLCYRLLEAAPLAGARLGSGLRSRIAERLETLGADLLRAWVLQLGWDWPAPAPEHAHILQRGRLCAECALHLALETRYPHPDEAYLAGLWHSLGELGAGPGVAAGTLAAELAACCELPAPAVDALLLQDALEEQLVGAHPLARLLQAARMLAEEQWQTRLGGVERLCRLDREAILSLRTDVGFLAGAEAPQPYLPLAAAPQPPAAWAAPPAAGNAMRNAALAALLRGAFTGLDSARIDARLTAGSRLLWQQQMPPLLVTTDNEGRLRALPLGAPAALRECYAELDLHADDDASVIALAARSGKLTVHLASADGPGRSPIDWHVARWLGRRGFACLPLPPGGCLAIHAVDDAPPAAAGPDPLMYLFTGAAAAAWLHAEAAQEASAAIESRVAERYREHGRRIAHEAANPLTVIRNYLGALAQREPDGGGLRKELGILDSELDRVAALLRQVTEPPSAPVEAPHCLPAALLADLRALYGETLFTRRGIQLDLRIPASTPAVAMPASALKQILLNLFRNAAEALQPGGRLSVALAGPVVVDGVPCLEIRLVDNGPGMPRERLVRLFDAQPSDKGDGHQGIGLAIVGELLGRWQSRLLCRSQPEVGTSFQLLIPLEGR